MLRVKVLAASGFSMKNMAKILYFKRLQLLSINVLWERLSEISNNVGLFDPEMLRFTYEDVFWNLIWYFHKYKLPVDFMLPYEPDYAARNLMAPISSNLYTPLVN